MEKANKKDYLIVKLIVGVVAGFLIGFIPSEGLINVVQSIKHVLGQIIFFMIPLVILGFIAPAIIKLKQNAGKMLATMLLLAYFSSIGAAIFSMISAYIIIPFLNITSSTEGIKELPEMIFKLDIPPIFSVMSALVLALLLGLSIVATKSEYLEKFMDEFNNIVLWLVNYVVVPILPFFIAATFAVLSYEGAVIKHLPVFLIVILIVLVGHAIWLTLLYTIAGIVSKKNPLEVLKHYGPAYVTALGTMSSTATLPVALQCARKSKVLDEEVVNFAIPLGTTIHLCGSVLTEVFFLMTVSQVLYGTLPELSTMILFITLLGVFAVGAPGVPGGTVMASLGIIVSVLGFDEVGVALMLTIFAIQDSFGTACNVTGDGALALILDGIFNKSKETSMNT